MWGRSRRGMGPVLLSVGLALAPLTAAAQSASDLSANDPMDGLAILGPSRAVANARQGGKVRACAPNVSSLPRNYTHLRTPPAESPRAVALGVCDVMIVPDRQADDAWSQLRALGVDVDGAGGGSTVAGATSYAATSGAGVLPGFVPGGRAGSPSAPMPAAPVSMSGPAELPMPAGLDPVVPDDRPAMRAPSRTASPAPRTLSAPRGADAPVRSISPVSTGPRTLAPVRGLDPSVRDRPLGSVGTAASRARTDEAQAWFSDGYDDLQRNRLESAASKFEQGLQLSPYNWLGLFYLAQAYDRMGRVEEAIPVYDQVIELSPRSPEATFARDRMRREGYTPRAESGSASRMADEPDRRAVRAPRQLSYEPEEPPERSVKEIFEGSEGAAYLKEMQEREARDKALPPLPQPVLRGRDIASEREGLSASLRRDRFATFDDGGNRFNVGTRLYAERIARPPSIERADEPLDRAMIERSTDPTPLSLRGPPTISRSGGDVTPVAPTVSRGWAQPEPTRTRLQSIEDSADGRGRIATRLGAERPIRIERTAVSAPQPMAAAPLASTTGPVPGSDVMRWGEPQPPQPISPLPAPPAPPTPMARSVETVPLSNAPPPAPMTAAPMAPVPVVPEVAPLDPMPPVPITTAPMPPMPLEAPSPMTAAPVSAPAPPVPAVPAASPLQSMTLAFPDGSRYVGEVGGGRPDGQGTLTYADGTRYTGGFVAGKRGGRGSLTLANGWRYEGDFVEDQPNGRGTLTQSDGTVYEGDFQVGRRTGNGTLSLPNGERYAGAVVDGVPNGRGTYTWPDGHRYEGDFRDGEIDGTGTMSYPGGRAVSGVWRNQELVRPL